MDSRIVSQAVLVNLTRSETSHARFEGVAATHRCFRPTQDDNVAPHPAAVILCLDACALCIDPEPNVEIDVSEGDRGGPYTPDTDEFSVVELLVGVAVVGVDGTLPLPKLPPTMASG